MKNLQQMGGIAALIDAMTYVVGFGMVFTLLAPLAGDLEPGQYVAFLVDNHTLMHVWHLIIYVVNGVFLVILALALYERLRAGSPALAQTATAFGLIWAGLVNASGMLIINDLGVIVDLYGQDPAQAISAWLVLSSVEEGLGGGVELPGGLWVLLVSWAALRTGVLPKMLNYLGVLIGVAGILTVASSVDVLRDVFGLGFLVWFAWVGIVMLRGSTSAAADKPDAIVPHHSTTA